MATYKQMSISDIMDQQWSDNITTFKGRRNYALKSRAVSVLGIPSGICNADDYLIGFLEEDGEALDFSANPNDRFIGPHLKSASEKGKHVTVYGKLCVQHQKPEENSFYYLDVDAVDFDGGLHASRRIIRGDRE